MAQVAADFWAVGSKKGIVGDLLSEGGGDRGKPFFSTLPDLIVASYKVLVTGFKLKSKLGVDQGVLMGTEDLSLPWKLEQTLKSAVGLGGGALKQAAAPQREQHVPTEERLK